MTGVQTCALPIWEEQLQDAREAADAWRRVLRMKAGDEEATGGLERAKAQNLKKPDPAMAKEAYAPPRLPVAPPPPEPKKAEPRAALSAPAKLEARVEARKLSEPPKAPLPAARSSLPLKAFDPPKPPVSRPQLRPVGGASETAVKVDRSRPRGCQLCPAYKPRTGTCAVARSRVLARSCPDFVAILACLDRTLRIRARVAFYATVRTTSPTSVVSEAILPRRLAHTA